MGLRIGLVQIGAIAGGRTGYDQFPNFTLSPAAQDLDATASTYAFCDGQEVTFSTEAGIL